VALFLIPTIVAQQEEEEAPWWAAISSYHFPHLYAMDLEDFVPQLQNTSADFVLIDFYAPWCPHCQHFAPDYERLALAIQRFDNQGTEEAVDKKPSILSATVDCVRFSSICDFWGVHQYPTLMWGRREDWLKRAQIVQPPQKPQQQSSDSTQSDSSGEDINVIEMDGTAESVAKWINNRTKFGLDISGISKREVVRLLHQSEATHKKVSTALHSTNSGADVWDAELATGLLLRDILEHHAFEDEVEEEVHARRKSRKGHRKHVKPALKSRNTTRGAFVSFVKLLGNRFPNRHGRKGSSCRDSLAELHSQLRNNWADLTQEVRTLQNMKTHQRLVMINPDDLEGQWRLCDRDWSEFKEGWHQCKGTWPGKRGFTCGLWNMFHFLAAHTTDEKALSDLHTVRNAVAHFFDCQECRDHFMQIPVPQDESWTRRDAQLWWWNAHNVVNRRVGKLEEMYDDGDPGYPKSQWPTEAECPKCRPPSPVQGARRLRLRRTSAETVSASGTVSAAPPIANISSLAQEDGKPLDVAVESVTLAEAVDREHWDLDEVARFLQMQYGTST
jgi:thiol oxidase